MENEANAQTERGLSFEHRASGVKTVCLCTSSATCSKRKNLHGKHFLHQDKVIGSDLPMAAFDSIAHIQYLTVVSPHVCVKTEVEEVEQNG